MKNHIVRKKYLEKLERLKNTLDIKIITGMRRSGKSRLVEDYIELLKRIEPSANIIYIDFFNLDFEDLKDYKTLYKYIESSYIEGVNNYLFIDEIQLCDKFELAINSLHNSEKYDIYITGSNAFLLNSDLTTLFTGRFIQINVYPFSFNEYIQYFEGDLRDKEQLFDKYIVNGGLAGSYLYQNDNDRVNYLKAVYKIIINRDLLYKYKLSNDTLLNKISEYLMDNISNVSSFTNISNALTNNKMKTNHVTVGKYIDYLCNAFIFYPVKRYDIRGKKYLDTSEKYYLSDVGFRFAMLGTRNMDYGRCYENIVALELLRREYNIYVGKLYKKEIDFIATKQNEKIYIQVSDNISNEETFEREVEPLLKIRDAYPKILLARTMHDEYQYEGIRVINIVDWLMNDKC